MDSTTLQAELTAVQQQLTRVTAERDEYKKLCGLLREENERLKRGLLGQKAERVTGNPDQLTLKILEGMLGNLANTSKPDEKQKTVITITRSTSRQRGGRQELPEHLPHVEVELIPEEVRREGLDHFVRIGEESSSVLERRPASVVVVHTVRPKFVRKPHACTPVLAPAEKRAAQEDATGSVVGAVADEAASPVVGTQDESEPLASASVAAPADANPVEAVVAEPCDHDCDTLPCAANSNATEGAETTVHLQDFCFQPPPVRTGGLPTDEATPSMPIRAGDGSMKPGGVATSPLRLLPPVGKLPHSVLAPTPAPILITPPLELPIERGLAGPGMLADTVVRRWCDHLPLNRLEGIFLRDGVHLARSTLCGWHMSLGELCRPLVEAMHQESLRQKVLLTDATGVLVLAKEKCRTGHFWVVCAPGLHVLFRYTPKHNRKSVDDNLAGFNGYLVADAHTVYEHLYGDGTVTEVGCWAHARRYYFKAMTSDPERAGAAIEVMRQLFLHERQWASLPPEQRKALRQEQSRPLVEQYFEWCAAQALVVLDESPIQAAIRYSLNQKQALMRFLEDGQLPMHNNLSERQLRRLAVGRKNWLFVGTDEGAEVTATFVTLLASCQMHQLNPWSYLRDLFCLLPSWPHNRVLELAPAHWGKTIQSPRVQERLATNPYRRVSMGLPPIEEMPSAPARAG